MSKDISFPEISSWSEICYTSESGGCFIVALLLLLIDISNSQTVEERYFSN